MHHTRRRTLIAIASAYRGPARRDAPTDSPTDGSAGGGGNAGGQGDPSGQPNTDPKPPTFTGDFDPERARTAIANARAAEKAALEAKRASDDRLTKVMAALGKNPDGTDLDDPAARATELAQRAQAAEDRAWTLGVRTATFELAPELGANAKLVYASNDFRDLLDDLVDDDPESKTFRDALKAKIKDFVEANPEYKASTGQGPARMGAEHSGAGNTGGQRVQGLGAAVTAAYRKQ